LLPRGVNPTTSNRSKQKHFRMDCQKVFLDVAIRSELAMLAIRAVGFAIWSTCH
jgi:hypothetical protein